MSQIEILYNKKLKKKKNFTLLGCNQGNDRENKRKGEGKNKRKGKGTLVS